MTESKNPGKRKKNFEVISDRGNVAHVRANVLSFQGDANVRPVLTFTALVAMWKRSNGFY